MAGPMIGSTTVTKSVRSARECVRCPRFKLVTCSVFGLACTGSEVELMFGLMQAVGKWLKRAPEKSGAPCSELGRVREKRS
jgi:hypothetical protein